MLDFSNKIILCLPILFLSTMLVSCSSSITYEGNPQVIVKQYTREEAKDMFDKPLMQRPEYCDYVTTLDFEDFPKDIDITVTQTRVYPSDPEIRTFYFPSTHSNYYYCNAVATKPPFVIESLGFLPGEKVDFTFSSKRCDFRYQNSVVPYPLKQVSKDASAFIEAELVSFCPLIYCVLIGDLKKEEPYTFRSESYEEVIEQNKIYKSKEVFMVMPDVRGKKGGIAKATVKRESGECLSVDLMWGTEIKNYRNECWKRWEIRKES